MTPYLYNYVPKQHWKTVNQTRATVDAFYSTGRNGYPGNIDGGALPSWLVFSLIGLVSDISIFETSSNCADYGHSLVPRVSPANLPARSSSILVT